MIIVFFFMSLLFYCVAADGNISTPPICQENFSCPGFSAFNYPFYKGADNRCGLIKVNCPTNMATIRFGGRSYDILGKSDSGSRVLIHNRTFEKLMENKTCEALMNNFTSPKPLLISISIAPFITLFKCTKNLSYAQQTDAYFVQPNYNSYNRCKDHNFYYKYSDSNAMIPNDIPPTCQVIQLPVKARWQIGPSDETNLFSLISPNFSVTFTLTPFCDKCYQQGGHCQTNKEHLQCLDAKKDGGINSTVVSVPSDRDGGINSTWVILLSAFGVGAVTIVIVIILYIKCKTGWRKMPKYSVNLETFLKDHEFQAPKRYSYSQVQKMTNSFEVKLGQGGFGSVYKGTLGNQNLVAVKVLSELKGNGEDFINEVVSVSRTSHVNIVSLVGFCLEGRQRALIYEFMPNGSLEKFIYSSSSSSNSQLGWEKLHEIAIGIARGLEYLHRGCNTRIVHFDIKPHNILLDKDFCPKISDFGLAKLFPQKISIISMSNMRGTPGYIAPELFSRSFGGVSHKSDVYSYGMMILEMVGGRRNIEVEVDHTCEIYFPHWIYKKIELDEKHLGLHGIVSEEENELTRKMIIVGLWCIQTNPLIRPTITKVLEMLERDSELIEMPPKPYLSSPSRSRDESTKDYSQP